MILKQWLTKKVQIIVSILTVLLLFLASNIGSYASSGDSPVANDIYEGDGEAVFTGERSKSGIDNPSSFTSGAPVGGPFLISDPGVTRDPGPSGTNIFTDRPAVAFTNCAFHPLLLHFLVVWYNDRPSNDDVYGQVLTADGAKFGGWWVIAAGQDANRRYPDATHSCNTNEFLVVWEEENQATGKFNIRGRRIESPSGQPLDPTIDVNTGAGLINRYKPKIAHAFSAGKYLVVWESQTQGNFQGSDIMGQYIGNAGNLIGTNFYIAQADSKYSHSNPDLAYNRRMNEFLVVWQRKDKSVTPKPYEEICGKIVRPDGSMKPGVITISTAWFNTNPAVAALPNVAANGRYLVVWEFESSPLPLDRDTYGRIVFGDGNLHPDFIFLSTDLIDNNEAAVAGSEDTQEFLVTWNQPVDATLSNKVISGRTVDANGKMTSNRKILGGQFVTPGPAGHDAEHGAVAGGPMGDYLSVFIDVLSDGTNWSEEVYGAFWGNRVFFPYLER